MKLTKYIGQIIPALFLSIFLTSCAKEVPVAELSDDEVVELIDLALQESSAGLTKSVELLIEDLEELSLEGICDSLYLKTNTYEYSGSVLNASLSSNAEWMLSCNFIDLPEFAEFNAVSAIDYSTNRVDSKDSSIFNGTVGGLLISMDAYSISANYERSGNRQGNFRENRILNSSLNLDLTNLQVSKSDFEIISGTAHLILVINSEGESFEYEGELVFSDDEAELTLGNELYTIALR
jgi:hypothetical protein